MSIRWHRRKSWDWEKGFPTLDGVNDNETCIRCIQQIQRYNIKRYIQRYVCHFSDSSFTIFFLPVAMLQIQIFWTCWAQWFVCIVNWLRDGERKRGWLRGVWIWNDSFIFYRFFIRKFIWSRKLGAKRVPQRRNSRLSTKYTTSW